MKMRNNNEEDNEEDNEDDEDNEGEEDAVTLFRTTNMYLHQQPHSSSVQ